MMKCGSQNRGARCLFLRVWLYLFGGVSQVPFCDGLKDDLEGNPKSKGVHFQNTHIHTHTRHIGPSSDPIPPARNAGKGNNGVVLLPCSKFNFEGFNHPLVGKTFKS